MTSPSQFDPSATDKSGPPLIAVGLVGLTTLLFEILLTRVFSVTMWYHFAFVAISLALFGLAASGVAVSTIRRFFNQERAMSHLAAASMALGLSVPVCFLLDQQIPFKPFDIAPQGGFAALVSYAAFSSKFLVLSVPFFFSGLVIAIAFTHFPAHAHRTYFADLVGGGIGCALVVPILLGWSGPTSVILSMVFALLASLLIYARLGRQRIVVTLATLIVLVIVFAIVNERIGLVKIRRVKSYDPALVQVEERPTVFERWHPVSRVAVHDVDQSGTPWYWFYSPTFRAPFPPVMEVTNDAGARTFLYPAMTDQHQEALFLGDVSDLVYAVAHQPKVLVIGVGGGKDLLSGLAFGAREVVGVELNPLMIDVAQREFQRFTGAPYDDERVRIAIAEGRNYIASRDEKYDIIKMSVTDTWAASAAGAYALTENYLYTIEAMREFFLHLEPDGFLTITRWFPDESLRLVALLHAALEPLTDGDLSQHVVLARNPNTVTAIVKRSRFEPDEVVALAKRVQTAKLKWIVGPSAGSELWNTPNPDLEQMADHLHRLALQESPETLERSLNTIVEPPTDNRPFFFNLISLSQAQKGDYKSESGFHLQHGRALKLLVGLFKTTALIALLFVVVPLILSRAVNLGSVPLLPRFSASVYFLMLGLGFMLVEIPLLQQYILFLGHPTYSLTVVLFSLLVSSGLGSLLSERITLHQRRMTRFLFPVLIGVIISAAVGLPPLLRLLIGLPLGARVLVSIGTIVPIGMVLGMPFPLGVRLAHRFDRSLVSWAWAVNGAASVAAPALAMILAINWGFSLTFILGGVAYVVAAVGLLGFRETSLHFSPIS